MNTIGVNRTIDGTYAKIGSTVSAEDGAFVAELDDVMGFGFTAVGFAAVGFAVVEFGMTVC